MRTALGILLRYLLVWAVNVVALLAVTGMLPGFRFDTTAPHWWITALILPIEFALVMIVLRPLLVLLTLPLNAVTLGLPTLFFNAILLFLVTSLHRSFEITGVLDAVLGLALVTLISTIAVGWLGIDETYPFFQSVLSRLGRRLGPRPPAGLRRGLLILQIDGLAHASLRRALLRGRMPAVSSLLASGTHQLHQWKSGLPSNTPAVQAGLMYGSRADAPGYRWYDRVAGLVRAASSPEDLRQLEERAADAGHTPLLAGGSCINSFMSGGAAKRLMTLTAERDPSSPRGRAEVTDFRLFWLSPFDYTKTMLSAMWDFGTGVVWTVVGRLAGHRGAVRRSLRQYAMRAVANTFLRDAAYFWIRQDLVRGVPIIYSNFVGYDEIAHFSGPDSYEALMSLTAFDRKIRRLLRLTRGGTPIAYDLLLLSDHGQSPSIPFRRLYGQSLEAVVADLVGPRVPHAESVPIGTALVGVLLRELQSARPAGLPPAADRNRRTLERLHEGEERARGAQAEAPLAICISGCLAHVYVTGRHEPATLGDIEAEFPGLVEKLASHPGIEFVAARLAPGEAVVIGAEGVSNLRSGDVRGEVDPLAPYTDRQHWARELARLMECPSSGDLVLNGSLLPGGGVVVFEEQISSHGGLGGNQTEPFLVAPTTMVLRRGDLASPEALHAVLVGSREELQAGVGGSG